MDRDPRKLHMGPLERYRLIPPLLNRILNNEVTAFLAQRECYEAYLVQIDQAV